jgi:2-amino-4-hydroxy-6-hydroxymethyldihydropteridine diphosphokinase
MLTCHSKRVCLEVKSVGIHISKLHAILALGSNQSGTFGDPEQTLAWALAALPAATEGKICATSIIYKTIPIGGGRQPAFLNQVVAVECRLSPALLLRRLKALERAAGRRLGRHWGPRALDIDIIDFRGWRLGRPAARRRAGSLVLPHPSAAKRFFVLRPVLDIAPRWQHPGLRVGGRQLLTRINSQRRGVQVYAAAGIAAAATRAT